MPRSIFLTQAVSARTPLRLASRDLILRGKAGNRSLVNLCPAARLHAPSSSTCPKMQRILPWLSPMGCSRISSSSEVSRASFTNLLSSNSSLLDEEHHQLLTLLGGEARRLRFTKRLERLANLSGESGPTFGLILTH